MEQRREAVRMVNEEIDCSSTALEIVRSNLRNLDTTACDQLMSECPAAAMFVSVELPR